MSVHVTSAVWKHSTHKGSALLLLLALSEWAHDDGSGVYPSVKSMMERTRLSERAVQYVLKELLESGEILRDGTSEHGTNRYRFDLETLRGAIFAPGAIPCNEGVQNGVVKGVQPIAPDPLFKNPLEEKELEPTVLGAKAPPTPIDLMEGWNEICAPAGLSKVCELSPTRRKKAALRLHEHPQDDFWNHVLGNIATSPFLRGLRPSKDHSKWKADFDWLIDNDTNVMKIYEGKYNNG